MHSGDGGWKEAAAAVEVVAALAVVDHGTTAMVEEDAAVEVAAAVVMVDADHGRLAFSTRRLSTLGKAQSMPGKRSCSSSVQRARQTAGER